MADDVRMGLRVQTAWGKWPWSAADSPEQAAALGWFPPALFGEHVTGGPIVAETFDEFRTREIVHDALELLRTLPPPIEEDDDADE